MSKQIARLRIKKLLNSIDLETDNSIQKFVNNKIGFNDLNYVPLKLEKIDSEYIYDMKWNLKLRWEALSALKEMWEEFYKEYWREISVLSAYRSYSYQKGIKDRWCPDNLCAKAWFSEHQSWLVIDFWEAPTNKQFLSNAKYKKYFEWLKLNGDLYWFHNTYQKWLDIDWYEIEPWHWRYVWKDLAKYLKENDITIAELYYDITKK